MVRHEILFLEVHQALEPDTVRPAPDPGALVADDRDDRTGESADTRHAFPCSTARRERPADGAEWRRFTTASWAAGVTVLRRPTSKEIAREDPDRSHPCPSCDDGIPPRDGARDGHLRASDAQFSCGVDAARLFESLDPWGVPQAGRHGDPSIEGPSDRMGPFAVPAEDRVLAGNGLRHPVPRPCSRTRLAWVV